MNIEFRADLHTHTYCSDGTDSPLELLQKAKNAGLQGLSITDHDTLDAYTDDFFVLAKSLGIEILPGIEISSEDGDASVHILGYNIDLSSQRFRLFLQEMIRRRSERNRKILAKLEQRGFVIQEEELLQHARLQFPGRTIGRPHIADFMVKKGYVSTMQAAFERYLREGGLCFVPGIRYTPLEVIDQVHAAGGKAVLAHPHFIKNGSLLHRLLALPFDGLECYYGTLLLDQERTWIELAKRKGWIATGGSDYHSTIKSHISLGCSWVGRDIFDLLRKETS